MLDSGARGSTTTFVQRGIGDVLLSWENEAFLALKEFGADKFEIVVALALDPGRAAGDRRGSHVDKRGHRAVATAYLEFLYSPEGQELIAARTSTARPIRRSPPGIKGQFAEVNLVNIEDLGGWQAAQKKHFADGGVFDQIYEAK